MGDSLTNIQTDARFWANDSLLNIISDATGLRMFNMAYRGLCMPEFTWLGVKLGRRWPETTRQYTSLTMVVGDESTYTWPTNPVFLDPTWVEGLATNNNNEPYPIAWAPDMATWSSFDDNANDTPVYCRLIDVSGTVKLAFRPNPIRTDGIRITGLIEITELVNGVDTTIFRNRTADRALALLVAAMYKSKRGESSKAMELTNMAASLLPVNDTTPTLTGGGSLLPWLYGNSRSWRRRR